MISKSNCQLHFDLSGIGDYSLCLQGRKASSSGNFYDYHIVSLCQQRDKQPDEKQRGMEGCCCQEKKYCKIKNTSKTCDSFWFFLLDCQIAWSVFKLASWSCENTLPMSPAFSLVMLRYQEKRVFCCWPTATFQSRSSSWGRGSAACWPERSVVKHGEASPCLSTQPVVRCLPCVSCHFSLNLILLKSFT